jgi:hypothetical protein
VPESTVELRNPVWSKPHIVEPWTKPLSFLDLLRPDEGEGVLLTERVCQSDWGSTHMLPQPAVH